MGGFERVEFTPEAEAAHQRTIAKRVALGLGTRTDHARTAIQRGGRWVRCTECGWRGKLRTGHGRRLRHQGCPECNGRMHVANWVGFEAAVYSGRDGVPAERSR